MTAICWLRRDLRIADNPALQAAIETGLPVVVVYLHVPHEDGDWQRGPASRAWLERSLLALQADLAQRGSTLVLRLSRSRQCGSLQLLQELVESTKATALFWQRQYEPSATARDQAIKSHFKASGLNVQSLAGYLLHEPWDLRTGAGDVYRVFTPYWRNASARLLPASADSAPSHIVGPKEPPYSEPLAALALRHPKTHLRGWEQGFWQRFTPGEAGAAEALDVFCQGALAHYQAGRDRPDQAGTSRLSAHLHFGEISVAQVRAGLASSGMPAASIAFYERELGWRDFSYQLLYEFPHIDKSALNAKYTDFPWAPESAQTRAQLSAWRRGRTGFPIIDAGMRELWQTGWMHNRVRMLVASFLCKNLRLPWQLGARWFWHTLVDADLANNTQGWQWSAGCGADAAPYFRIFNPVTQGEKFDPNGDYVRQFVPELAHLPGHTIHQPWLRGGVKGYPAPIVDLKQTRDSALAAFSAWRAG